MKILYEIPMIEWAEVMPNTFQSTNTLEIYTILYDDKEKLYKVSVVYGDQVTEQVDLEKAKHLAQIHYNGFLSQYLVNHKRKKQAINLIKLDEFETLLVKYSNLVISNSKGGSYTDPRVFDIKDMKEQWDIKEKLKNMFKDVMVE